MTLPGESDGLTFITISAPVGAPVDHLAIEVSRLEPILDDQEVAAALERTARAAWRAALRADAEDISFEAWWGDRLIAALDELEELSR